MLMSLKLELVRGSYDGCRLENNIKCGATMPYLYFCMYCYEVWSLWLMRWWSIQHCGEKAWALMLSKEWAWHDFERLGLCLAWAVGEYLLELISCISKTQNLNSKPCKIKVILINNPNLKLQPQTRSRHPRYSNNIKDISISRKKKKKKLSCNGDNIILLSPTNNIMTCGKVFPRVIALLVGDY